jgi:hypothetical protein
MQSKVIIDRYSERLNLDKAELMVGDELVASGTSGNIQVLQSISKHYPFMVTLCDENGIGTTFFHCQEVQDLRKVKVS